MGVTNHLLTGMILQVGIHIYGFIGNHHITWSYESYNSELPYIPWIIWVILLMVQKSGVSPVEVGTLPHYLRRVSKKSQVVEGFWTINSRYPYREPFYGKLIIPNRTGFNGKYHGSIGKFHGCFTGILKNPRHSMYGIYTYMFHKKVGKCRVKIPHKNWILKQQQTSPNSMKDCFIRMSLYWVDHKSRL